MDIVTCADVRICTPGTKFSVKEVDIGIAADVGTLTRLGKVVGQQSWVRDVCLTAREFGGKEAREVGFCSWVGGQGEMGKAGDSGKGEMMKEALRWAEMVAGKSPVAVQGTKEILDWSRDRSVEDGIFFFPFPSSSSHLAISPFLLPPLHLLLPPRSTNANGKHEADERAFRPPLHSDLEQRHGPNKRCPGSDASGR